MINEKMTTQLNVQFNKELYSAYLYLGMSAWCANAGYNGAASWFMLQYDEEQMHALKIYKYMLSQGSKIELMSIEKPEMDYASLLKCFQYSLLHEQKMTKSFNKLCDLAIKQKDHTSYGFFQWFLQEQIEEEATVAYIISELNHVDDKNGIFMIDNKLSERNATKQGTTNNAN